MREIATRGKIMMVPEATRELSAVQFRYFAFLISLWQSGEIDESYFRRRWLSYLLGMRDYTILKQEYIDEIERQADVIDGFIEKGRPDLHYTNNVLPEFAGYKGPGDWLEGLTFGEFTECMAVMEEIADGGDLKECYEHVARLLYRVPEEKQVPELLTFHAPVFFAAVWGEISSNPIKINGKKIDFSLIFKDARGAKSANDQTGWAGITFEVAATGVFGTVKEVEKTDFWQVLLYLYKCKFEYIHETAKNK